MKGIVLAGGSGTRLRPLTLSISKQLLPIYNKPLIYYSLSTLMLAGIRDIALICKSQDLSSYSRLLGNGNQLGINIEYLIQDKPEGIAHAFLLAENFIQDSNVALILGDNIFYGKGLGRQLNKLQDIHGAHIFAHQVKNPSEFGVIEFDQKLGILDIEEKPQLPKSNYVVPGLYFYDKTVISLAKKLKPSKRGELEITDLNKMFLRNNNINVTFLDRGTAWFDTGTFESMHDASTFIRITESSQGERIGCLEEIAFRQGWINAQNLKEIAKNISDSDLSEYLESLI